MVYMTEDKKPKYNSQRKYITEKRDKLGLNLEAGLKEKWKAYAAERNMSLTEYITKLIEEDNK